MNRRFVLLMFVAMSLTLSSAAFAEAPDSAAPGPHGSAGAGARPVLPRDAAWAGVMVIVIVGGLFLPAAVIGPIARALAPEDEPETTSHDEHGGSHHHAADAKCGRPDALVVGSAGLEIRLGRRLAVSRLVPLAESADRVSRH